MPGSTQNENSMEETSPIEVLDDTAVSAEHLKFLQQCAVAALVPGTGFSEAAALCGVSRTTLWRWSKLPHFQDALQAARQAAFAEANANLKFYARDAVHTLTRNLRSGDPGAEIRSAIAILNHAHKAVALLEHESRILAAERTLKNLAHKEETNSPETTSCSGPLQLIELPEASE